MQVDRKVKTIPGIILATRDGKTGKTEFRFVFHSQWQNMNPRTMNISWFVRFMGQGS